MTLPFESSNSVLLDSRLPLPHPLGCRVLYLGTDTEKPPSVSSAPNAATLLVDLTLCASVPLAAIIHSFGAPSTALE